MRDRYSREFSRKAEEKHAVNEQIRAPEVRVIGVDGAQLGVMKTSEALRLAAEQGVDLIEVAAEAQPPVCRLLDYGKLKYREQKKAAEARKKSATHSTKELRVRYNTDSHDLETKVKNAREFLKEGDKVRFTMRFRGRESVYQELGHKIFEQIQEMLQDIAVVDERTPMLGQRMIIGFAPRPHGVTK